MSENGVGYRLLAGCIIVRAMKDSVGKTTGSSEGRTHLLHGRKQTCEEIQIGAEEWLRESVQCKRYLEWLDWPCTGEELAELAKDGIRWHQIAHTISRLLVA